MLKEVDYAYYEWLIAQIATPNNGKTYHQLFDRLHQTEFVWLVPNDDNRVADGKELRGEFSQYERVILPFEGVSVLEVIISLSRRVAFISDRGDAHIWAWKLIKNLRMNRMSDPLSTGNMNRIDDILQVMIWRAYRPDGVGGFFPLDYPREDQTKIEIWYQMNAYIIEKEGP